ASFNIANSDDNVFVFDFDTTTFDGGFNNVDNISITFDDVAFDDIAITFDDVGMEGEEGTTTVTAETSFI
ncbi:11452_t:CDS:1, partial [Funneliformis geosporum]